MRTVAQKLATAVGAYHRCAARNDTEMCDKWEERIDGLVRNHLPSGSGFDAGTCIDLDRCTGEKLYFHTSYHHMDDAGCYDGWTDHSVKVRPRFSGLRIKVGGRNRDNIKDAISDMFHVKLQEAALMEWDEIS